MSLDSTDVPGAALAEQPRRSRRRGAASDLSADGAPLGADWRLGGATVRRWRAGLLAIALISVGAAVLLGSLATVLLPAWGGLAATAILWIGMLVPILWAVSRSRPAGLLRFRFLDLLWGVGLGLVLRTVQGWLAVAAGGSGALPSYPSIGGSLPQGFWFSDVIAPVLIAPVVEELFFHAVVLVSVYTLLRRAVGAVMAGAAAVVVSAALFVMLHSLAGALTVDSVISLGLLGLVCGSLVMLTGRIWPAILVHVVYNATFVVLALAGTFLG